MNDIQDVQERLRQRITMWTAQRSTVEAEAASATFDVERARAASAVQVHILNEQIQNATDLLVVVRYLIEGNAAHATARFDEDEADILNYGLAAKVAKLEAALEALMRRKDG